MQSKKIWHEFAISKNIWAEVLAYEVSCLVSGLVTLKSCLVLTSTGKSCLVSGLEAMTSRFR